ncbi:MAG: DUF4838 domain-containing protein [Verrucomicrobia bacterium]|nr:DUF4838 domain-containing protein [Verrucomicrobiota bacterium]
MNRVRFRKFFDYVFWVLFPVLVTVMFLQNGCTRGQGDRAPGRTEKREPPAVALELVKNGASPYAIYLAPTAPASVKLAAEELQAHLEKSTGVKLPILNETRSPMICLGDNEESRRAGFASDALSDEGFRMVTKAGNLYIVGKDWPDDNKKWDRCDSTGTLWGVYDFLERVVGVRWLMPGPLGEDIPQHRESLRVPALDLAEAPPVLSRVLECSPRDHPDVRVWQRRHRLGKSIEPAYGHNWADHPSTPVLLAHPEYMPLHADGTREKPIGDRAWGSYEHKFCLSNPGLIEAFANSLIASLDKNPRRFGESMAPSDGTGGCVCPECRKFKLTDTNGSWGDFPPYGYSQTPLVLHFYNGVARIVGKKYPDRWVGGLAYTDYVYPPYEKVKIDPNVFISIAINAGYGFKFYKPETAARVQKIISGWAGLVRNLGWYDVSTWMRNPAGAPLPPGIPIIKTTFAAFGKSLKAINYQAQEAWGYGAAHNYVVAKMIWNPQADAGAIYCEFLKRAYGPAASTMERLHDLVEESLRKYIIQKPYPDHEIWYDTAQEVYAPIHAQIEQLCLKARAEAQTENQKKRLEMFGDNLVMLNWNLRRAGLIKPDEKSPFFRTDEAYDRFLSDRKGSMAIVDLAFYEKWRWQTALWNPENRSIAIRSLPAGVAAPRIDGDLGDPAWQPAAVADGFRQNECRREAAHRQTSVKLMCDPETLYVAFTCREDEVQKIRRECKTKDSDSLIKDDVVELCFQPVRGNPVEISVNAANTTKVCGKVNLTSGTRVGDTSWVVEMAIPFENLGLAGPPAGATWRGNFARRRVGPPIECSTWNRVEERLEDPRGFGELRFEEGKPTKTE